MEDLIQVTRAFFSSVVTVARLVSPLLNPTLCALEVPGFMCLKSPPQKGAESILVLPVSLSHVDLLQGPQPGAGNELNSPQSNQRGQTPTPSLPTLSPLPLGSWSTETHLGNTSLP